MSATLGFVATLAEMEQFYRGVHIVGSVRCV